MSKSRGPTPKILLGTNGIEVNSQGLDGVKVKSPGAEVEVNCPTVTVDASAITKVK